MGASEVVYSVQHQPYTLSPWTGFGVFCGYAAAALIVGFFLISRRDAESPALTVAENLAFSGFLHGLRRDSARRRATELIEVFSLADVAGQRAARLSGGLRRRLDLAQALVHRPPVLFLDEPTTGLDPQSRRALWERLRQLSREGVTVLLTTQYLEEADRTCDRVAILEQGRLVRIGSPAALKEEVGGGRLVLTVPGLADLERAADALAAAETVVRVQAGGQADGGWSCTCATPRPASRRSSNCWRPRGYASPALSRHRRPSMTCSCTSPATGRGPSRGCGDRSAACSRPRTAAGGTEMTRRDRKQPIVLVLAVRNLLRNIRTPMLVTAALVQPLVWLVLFAQIFGRLGDTGQFTTLGYSSYVQFFVPGMIVLSMLFTALQSGVATVTDIDTGVMDKLLISPIRRTAILIGRVAADAVTMLAQGVIVLAVAHAMGARVHTGFGGAVAIVALAVLFGVVWASLSNLIALRSRNSEVTMVAGLFLTLPALFLTSAFFPKPDLPVWLQGVMNANPAAYVISTGQQLMSTGNSGSQDLKTLAALA
jgi:ABC transporter DrrB family efflux protein